MAFLGLMTSIDSTTSLLLRREEVEVEPGSWRGTTAGGGAASLWCIANETGAAAAADAATALAEEASSEKTIRLGLRGRGDFVPPVLIDDESLAELLLKGSCCFWAELLDVGERLFFFFFLKGMVFFLSGPMFFPWRVFFALSAALLYLIRDAWAAKRST